ncbi:proline--tRNA ligase [Candidatus Margulisiibacteriota bacterium]
MKMSQLFTPTLREDPSEAEIASHKLMIRAGMLRRLAAGIYKYLPLGWRVIHKIESIVREEMDRAGALEVKLPAILPSDLWKETGRWDIYGKELFRVKDRHEREYCLGPTHEEIITDLVRNDVKSYKELPLNLYQIQTKYRDEIRPRFGVMRAREFIMKDAYSFDKDEKGLDKSYERMYETYNRIFDRCGLKYKVVEADPGPIGGGFSQEYMVLSPTGEDEIMHCTKCAYAAAHEMAAFKATSNVKHQTSKQQGKDKVPKMEKVKTPDVKTIEELEAFLKVPPERMIKTLLHKAGDEVIAVLIRGDHHLNEARLKKLLGREDIELADAETVQKVSGAPVGFAGPVGLKNVKILADEEVTKVEDGVTGANAKDTHVIHVKYGRDYKADEVHMLRLANEGDLCPKCGGKLVMTRGIEVGHIFKLGTKYSNSMKATFLDEKSQEKLFVMGCYGIGVSRIAGAAIEQNHDEWGIKWPISIAPYQVAVVPVNSNEKTQTDVAVKIYEQLKKAGVEVVYDDRDASVGVKLKDIDLIGFPIKVIIGPKGLKDNKVELKLRSAREVEMLPADKAVKKIEELVKQGR